MQSKLDFRKMICRSQLRFCIALKDFAIVRDRRKKTVKMYMEGHLQHAFSYSVQLAKENRLF